MQRAHPAAHRGNATPAARSVSLTAEAGQAEGGRVAATLQLNGRAESAKELLCPESRRPAAGNAIRKLSRADTRTSRLLPGSRSGRTLGRPAGLDDCLPARNCRRCTVYQPDGAFYFLGGGITGLRCSPGRSVAVPSGILYAREGEAHAERAWRQEHSHVREEEGPLPRLPVWRQ